MGKTTLDDYLVALQSQNPQPTNTEIGRLFGVSEATVRRRKDKVGFTPEYQPDPLTITGSDNEISFEGLESENPLDPRTAHGPNGAFSRVFELAALDPDDFELVQDTFKFSTWQQSRALSSGERDLVQLYSYRGSFRRKNQALLTLDDVYKAFDKTKSLTEESKDKNVDEETFVVALSDLQTGKTDESGNTYNLAERINSVLGQIEEHLKHRETNYAEIILVDAGDIIEGFNNTTQQAQTNDLSLTDQLRFAQRVVVESIKRLVPYAADFTYIAVPSNHCRNRTGIGNKNSANAPDDDFGLLIQDNTELALSNLPGFEHIRYVRPEKWEEAVSYACADGTVLGVTHGHQFTDSTKAKDWLAGMALGHRSGMDTIDVLNFGHHHHFSLELAGYGQQLIGNPSIDNGSSWFSNVKGVSSPASMLTFVLSGKKSCEWRIWYP